MSKKSRRSRAKIRKVAPSTKAAHSEYHPMSEPKSVASSIESPLSPAKISQHEYVLPELKNIGIIAGALLLVLIALTFVLG